MDKTRMPTSELYDALQKVYNHFNTKLFADSLPPVLFTTQRKKNVMGYFACNRWIDTEGMKCSEIAINPSYVGRSTLLELFQTIVHEMVHCWQYEHGTPSRRTYHNREWAQMMEDCGLMPSSTGKPGGKRTGQKISDYPIPGGYFIKECEYLIKSGFTLPWFDRVSLSTSECDTEIMSEIIESLELDEELTAQLTTPLDHLLGEVLLETDTVTSPPARTKTRYTCDSCSLNVWGKPGLAISCDDCELTLTENIEQ